MKLLKEIKNKNYEHLKSDYRPIHQVAKKFSQYFVKSLKRICKPERKSIQVIEIWILFDNLDGTDW